MTNLNDTLVSPSELSAAYRVASDRSARRVARGTAIKGYKVGYTALSRWKELGITAPMWGAMYDDSVVQAATGLWRYRLPEIHGPRIEPELVVHFHEAPDPDASVAGMLACIDWVAHGFEIVVTPLDGKQPTVPEAIMNGGMHGILVLGEARPIADLGADPDTALQHIGVELYCDGVLKEAGSGANVMGSPLKAIRALMAGLEREGMARIKAGDIVSTGTMTAAFPITPGQRWTTRLSGTTLPGLDVVFE